MKTVDQREALSYSKKVGLAYCSTESKARLSLYEVIKPVSHTSCKFQLPARLGPTRRFLVGTFESEPI